MPEVHAGGVTPKAVFALFGAAIPMLSVRITRTREYRASKVARPSPQPLHMLVDRNTSPVARFAASMQKKLAERKKGREARKARRRNRR